MTAQLPNRRRSRGGGAQAPRSTWTLGTWLCIAALSLSCSGPSEEETEGPLVRDPGPVLERLELGWTPPQGTRPMVYSDAPVHSEVSLRGTGERAVVSFSARLVLDATKLLTLRVERSYDRVYGSAAVQRVLLELTNSVFEQVLASGLCSDGPMRLPDGFGAVEISTADVTISSPRPREEGQLVRSLVTDHGAIVVATVIRPSGWKGTPGPGMQMKGPVLIDVHVTALGHGFQAP